MTLTEATKLALSAWRAAASRYSRDRAIPSGSVQYKIECTDSDAFADAASGDDGERLGIQIPMKAQYTISDNPLKTNRQITVNYCCHLAVKRLLLIVHKLCFTDNTQVRVTHAI